MYAVIYRPSALCKNIAVSRENGSNGGRMVRYTGMHFVAVPYGASADTGAHSPSARSGARGLMNYVIVTPAYNEAAFLPETIESVLRQHLLPRRWLIVDDGSTDGTAALIAEAVRNYPFIGQVSRTRDDSQPYYARNVEAIMAGYRSLGSEPFDYVAILDADIVLPPQYYWQLLAHFASDNRLGVASGIYQNLENGRLQPVLHDRRSTPKAIMVFKKEVFEQIGGFLPLKHGGEDTAACAMARMYGWKTWSFPDLTVIHKRPTGTGTTQSLLRVRFLQGIAEYSLATHPLFLLLKSLRRMALEPPLLAGGVARLCGYIWARLRRNEMELPPEVIAFTRQEQLKRVFSANRIPAALVPETKETGKC